MKPKLEINSWLRWLPNLQSIKLTRSGTQTLRRTTGPNAAHRRILMVLIAVGLALPLLACGQGSKKMQKDIVLNVVMYSNVDRVITDIIFDGTDLGVMNKYGTTGTVTGVRIPFGVQTLRWTLGGPEGTPRNGEQVTIKNTLVISPDQIPDGTRYLGLHLYPDDTAEVTFAEFIPERTPRGKQIRANRKPHE
ncbi:MAG: hypothetical protein ACLGI6_05620 [Gammaproteobacteria bacterium]